MTTLHPEFHQKLLAVYYGLENDQHQPQLTRHDLEKYETLVCKRHTLQMALQGEIGRPAVASSASAGKRDLHDKIKEELQRIDNEINCTLSDCMPDFHAVHNNWFGRYQGRALNKADSAYGSRLWPIAGFLGAFMVIGIISLLLLLP
jgi:hypothetical protein